VQYRRISTEFDDPLMGVLETHPRLQRLPGFRNPKRPYFASRLAYLEYSLKVAADLRRQHCDLIHIQNFFQFAPIIRAFNPQAKIVLHMQCEWLNQLDPRMVKPRLRNCDLIVCCSHYIANKIRNAFPEFGNRCRVVYNGVDVDNFAPNGQCDIGEPAKKTLLFVGRISPEKGVHVLLEAFKKVVERYPQVELRIIGPEWIAPPEYIIRLTDDEKILDLARFFPGSYLAQLRQMVTPEIADRVSFIPNLPYPDLAQHYQKADVFVCPSVGNDPSPLTIGEAMSTGVAIVATRGGGLPELVVEGETGLLVERGNAGALAEAILRLLQDSGVRQRMGLAGRQRALRLFSWDKIAEDILLEYHRLTYQREMNAA